MNRIKAGFVFLILSLFVVGCSNDFEGKWTLKNLDYNSVCPGYLVFYEDDTMSFPDFTGKLEHMDGTKYKFNHPIFTEVFDLERDGSTLYMTKLMDENANIKKNSKKPTSGGFFYDTSEWLLAS